MFILAKANINIYSCNAGVFICSTPSLVFPHLVFLYVVHTGVEHRSQVGQMKHR